MITPQAFFLALFENSQDGSGNQIVQDGLLQLRKVILTVRNPLVQQAKQDRSGSSLEDLISGYVQSCLESSSRVSLSTIQTWCGVRTSFVRYLRHARTQDASIERQEGLFGQLLHQKLSRIVRQQEHFTRIYTRQGAAYCLKNAPNTHAPIESEATLPDVLPPIESILTGTSVNKSPEVAKTTDLYAQLVRIFERTGNKPQPLTRLCHWIWLTLSPTPSSPKARDVQDPSVILPEHERASPEVDLASKQDLRRIIQDISHRIVHMDPVERKSVELRWFSKPFEVETYEQIAKILQISKSSVHLYCKDFEEQLRSLQRCNELSAEELRTVIDAIFRQLEGLKASSGAKS